jgi:stress-induced morphogen
MITAEQIEAKLRAAFPTAEHIRVVDTTGTFDHYEAVVVDASFEGAPRVRQHQAVYAALGDSMRADIHALALKTLTPKRWAAAQSK